MQIIEVIDESAKAMKVRVNHEGSDYTFWVPKTCVHDFDIDDEVAMEKIDGIINDYHDPSDAEEEQ